MGIIIDFKKFREDKIVSDRLEEKYLKYLTHVNKFNGVPTTFDKALEALYFTLRYLEGTVNGLSILMALGVSNLSRSEVDNMKGMLLSWLKDIEENIKNC